LPTMVAASGLPENSRAILNQRYPRFSASEMQRRRKAVEKLMAEAEIDHLIVYGANRFGGGIQWLTHWPVTAEAACVVSPGEQDTLFVQYYNHVRQAGILASEADVKWAGEFGLGSAIIELKRRGAGQNRVGVMGPLGFRAYDELREIFGRVADLTAAYTSLRMIKSAEEVERLRIGAIFSDRSIALLREQLQPGINERQVGAIIEQAYVADGGVNYIHFVGVTPMGSPDCCVPQQHPSTRPVAVGDVLFTEISASFWGYPGQILRTFSIGAEPTPLYRELHDVADAAFDAMAGVVRSGAWVEDAIAASEVIEAAGFTTNDDILHGFGGGYLPPIVGSRSRPAGPVPQIKFAAGMTVVIQPNVVTKDGKAGVQTGELVLVTEAGIERLHTAPRGFFHVQ
jgi:Xaa-Pro dipeptidase